MAEKMIPGQHNCSKFLFLAGSSILAASLTGCVHSGANSSDGNGPDLNIILIIADDLGWSDLSCYGADFHETPNIDQLAEKGMKFNRAYAAAPVSTPTRASIMTGKFPGHLNMTIWSESAINSVFNRKLIPPDVLGDLPLEEHTLPELLKKKGYVTAHVGKWHLGGPDHYPENQGFDINVGGTHWGTPAGYFYPYSGMIYNSKRYVPGLERNVFGDYELEREGEYLTDRLTDEAIKIMEDFSGRPFFIHLSFHNVHVPTEGEPEWVHYYENRKQSGYRHQNVQYAAMVASVDENVGRIMNKIRYLDIEHKTVIIFYSDNGGYINYWDGRKVTDNYPLRNGKGSLYEGGLRVPAIIYCPGITTGRDCSESISTIDILPTVMDLLGSGAAADTLAGLDGVSLLPLMKDSTRHIERPLFFHYPHYYETTTPVSSIIYKGWKLMKYYEGPRWELYDLNSDPGETENLVEKNPDKAGMMEELLEEWLLEVSASLPVENTTNP